MTEKKKPLKVFISYSHDSAEHIKKVRTMSDILRSEYGIDITLDKYEEDNPPGGLLTTFMETITTADRVICVVTPKYKKKADKKEAGVGYEASIISSCLLKDVNSNQIIPITISEELNFEECLPTFLSSRNSILRSAYKSDKAFHEQIARTLSQCYKNPKPAIVEKFSYHAEKISRNTNSINYKELIEADKLESLISHVTTVVRNNDGNSFQELYKTIKELVLEKLIKLQNCKEKEDNFTDEKLKNPDVLNTFSQPFIDAAAPFFLISLIALTSSNCNLLSQQSFLIDLLYNDDWQNKPQSYIAIKYIPYLLAYIHHHLYGAILAMNNQLLKIVDFFKIKIPKALDDKSTYINLYENQYIMGYPHSWGRDCFKSFQFLLNSYTQWNWLSTLFDNEKTYKESLINYQLAISFGYFLNDSKRDHDEPGLKVPPTFILSRSQKHIAFFMRNRSQIDSYLSSLDINRATLIARKDEWNQAIGKYAAALWRDDFFHANLKLFQLEKLLDLT